MELNVKQLIMAINTIATEKNLPEDTVLDVVQQAIAAAWRRDHGDREMNVRAELNTVAGTAKIFIQYEVVEDVENAATQKTLEEAQKIKKDAQLGDIVEVGEEATTFGRVAAMTARQVVIQRLREAEREVILNEFEDKVGTLMTGTVIRTDARLARLEIGKATAIMPEREQIQGERLSVGSRIRVFIKAIERDERGAQVIASRADAGFIEALFAQEVPEMDSGAVEIKAIAREAGRRTKLAVISHVPGVDAVGTFVGGHGTRVQAVMNEVGDQEKIDIVVYSENTEEFIRNALSPAEVKKIEINEADKKAAVYTNEDQQSIAIGRGGQNVRLAGQLTGYQIDIVATGTAAETPKAKAPAKPRKDIEDSLLSALDEQS